MTSTTIWTFYSELKSILVFLLTSLMKLSVSFKCCSPYLIKFNHEKMETPTNFEHMADPLYAGDLKIQQ
jgi:hypothetical protein